MQGYFCARTHWNAVPEVLCQKEASRNSIPESFFPDISVSNTFPSSTAFWVTVLSGTYVFRKIALVTGTRASSAHINMMSSLIRLLTKFCFHLCLLELKQM
jgi:hypothetical protein